MNRPIGIFDSGIGGLTVVKAICNNLPNESIIYFGDTARVPYGPKSKETIQRFSKENTEFLISKNIKAILVACNTATSYALSYISNKYDYPFLGVIKPGAVAAVNATKNGKIGVIGTEGTISSKAYEHEIRKLSKDVEIYSIPCPLFVSLVEEGWLNGKITEDIIKVYLNSFIEFGVDVIILGCTHYPLLKSSIQKVIGEKIKLVDSSEALVSEFLKRDDIEKNTISNERTIEFYVSDAPEKFKIIGQRFLGSDIKKVKKIKVWEA